MKILFKTYFLFETPQDYVDLVKQLVETLTKAREEGKSEQEINRSLHDYYQTMQRKVKMVLKNLINEKNDDRERTIRQQERERLLIEQYRQQERKRRLIEQYSQQQRERLLIEQNRQQSLQDPDPQPFSRMTRSRAAAAASAAASTKSHFNRYHNGFC